MDLPSGYEMDFFFLCGENKNFKKENTFTVNIGEKRWNIKFGNRSISIIMNFENAVVTNTQIDKKSTAYCTSRQPKLIYR